MSSVVCTHLDRITVRELPASVDGCRTVFAWAASRSICGSA